jgi:hypothetical protein
MREKQMHNNNITPTLDRPFVVSGAALSSKMIKQHEQGVDSTTLDEATSVRNRL